VKDYFSQVIVVPKTKKDVIEEICQRYSSQDIIFADDKAIFFNDIDMEKCKNLKTVLFNEHGLENLIAEIEVNKKEESKEISKTAPSTFLKDLH
jgi:hypothetical protein